MSYKMWKSRRPEEENKRLRKILLATLISLAVSNIPIFYQRTLYPLYWESVIVSCDDIKSAYSWKTVRTLAWLILYEAS